LCKVSLLVYIIGVYRQIALLQISYIHIYIYIHTYIYSFVAN